LENWDGSLEHREGFLKSIRTAFCLGPMRLPTETNSPSRSSTIYFRFFETADEYFDYAPAKVPPQGRWRIYGIELPESILHKVYNQNAARLLHITI
jgi:hypothetical protein